MSAAASKAALSFSESLFTEIRPHFWERKGRALERHTEMHGRSTSPCTWAPADGLVPVTADRAALSSYICKSHLVCGSPRCKANELHHAVAQVQGTGIDVFGCWASCARPLGCRKSCLAHLSCLALQPDIQGGSRAVDIRQLVRDNLELLLQLVWGRTFPQLNRLYQGMSKAASEQVDGVHLNMRVTNRYQVGHRFELQLVLNLQVESGDTRRRVGERLAVGN